MDLFLLTLAATGGMILSLYPSFARRKGWRIWRSLRPLGGATASIGFASMAAACILIVLRADWWLVIILLGIGALVGMALMTVLKSTVQALAVALLGFGWLWFVLIEARW